MSERLESDALEDAAGLDPIITIEGGIPSSREEWMKRSYSLKARTIALLDAVAFAEGATYSATIDEAVRQFHDRLPADVRRRVDAALAISRGGKP